MLWGLHISKLQQHTVHVCVFCMSRSIYFVLLSRQKKGSRTKLYFKHNGANKQAFFSEEPTLVWELFAPILIQDSQMSGFTTLRHSRKVFLNFATPGEIIQFQSNFNRLISVNLPVLLRSESLTIWYILRWGTALVEGYPWGLSKIWFQNFFLKLF